MGIEMYHHEGRTGPRIRCDGCKEFITDGTGNVEHLVDVESGEPVGQIFFFHKTCPDGYHRQLKPDAKNRLQDASYELDHILIWLAQNSGVDLHNKEVIDRAQEFGQLRFG
jgi:hypothetical protein